MDTMYPSTLLCLLILIASSQAFSAIRLDCDAPNEVKVNTPVAMSDICENPRVNVIWKEDAAIIVFVATGTAVYGNNVKNSKMFVAEVQQKAHSGSSDETQYLIDGTIQVTFPAFGHYFLVAAIVDPESLEPHTLTSTLIVTEFEDPGLAMGVDLSTTVPENQNLKFPTVSGNTLKLNDVTALWKFSSPEDGNTNDMYFTAFDVPSVAAYVLPPIHNGMSQMPEDQSLQDSLQSLYKQQGSLNDLFSDQEHKNFKMRANQWEKLESFDVISSNMVTHMEISNEMEIPAEFTGVKNPQSGIGYIIFHTSGVPLLSESAIKNIVAIPVVYEDTLRFPASETSRNDSCSIASFENNLYIGNAEEYFQNSVKFNPMNERFEDIHPEEMEQRVYEQLVLKEKYEQLNMNCSAVEQPSKKGYMKKLQQMRETMEIIQKTIEDVEATGNFSKSHKEYLSKGMTLFLDYFDAYATGTEKEQDVLIEFTKILKQAASAIKDPHYANCQEKNSMKLVGQLMHTIQTTQKMPPNLKLKVEFFPRLFEVYKKLSGNMKYTFGLMKDVIDKKRIPLRELSSPNMTETVMKVYKAMMFNMTNGQEVLTDGARLFSSPQDIDLFKYYQKLSGGLMVHADRILEMYKMIGMTIASEGSILMGKPGELTDEEICRGYVEDWHHKVKDYYASEEEDGPVFSSFIGEMKESHSGKKYGKSYYRKNKDGIYMGKYSMLLGKAMWKKIAVCSCRYDGYEGRYDDGQYGQMEYEEGYNDYDMDDEDGYGDDIYEDGYGDDIYEDGYGDDIYEDGYGDDMEDEDLWDMENGVSVNLVEEGELNLPFGTDDGAIVEDVALSSEMAGGVDTSSDAPTIRDVFDGMSPKNGIRRSQGRGGSSRNRNRGGGGSATSTDEIDSLEDGDNLNQNGRGSRQRGGGQRRTNGGSRNRLRGSNSQGSRDPGRNEETNINRSNGGNRNRQRGSNSQGSRDPGRIEETSINRSNGGNRNTQRGRNSQGSRDQGRNEETNINRSNGGSRNPQRGRNSQGSRDPGRIEETNINRSNGGSRNRERGSDSRRPRDQGRNEETNINRSNGGRENGRNRQTMNEDSDQPRIGVRSRGLGQGRSSRNRNRGNRGSDTSTDEFNSVENGDDRNQNGRGSRQKGGSRNTGNNGSGISDEQRNSQSSNGRGSRQRGGSRNTGNNGSGIRDEQINSQSSNGRNGERGRSRNSQGSGERTEGGRGSSRNRNRQTRSQTSGSLRDESFFNFDEFDQDSDDEENNWFDFEDPDQENNYIYFPTWMK